MTQLSWGQGKGCLGIAGAPVSRVLAPPPGTRVADGPFVEAEASLGDLDGALVAAHMRVVAIRNELAKQVDGRSIGVPARGIGTRSYTVAQLLARRCPLRFRPPIVEETLKGEVGRELRKDEGQRRNLEDRIIGFPAAVGIIRHEVLEPTRGVDRGSIAKERVVPKWQVQLNPFA